MRPIWQCGGSMGLRELDIAVSAPAGARSARAAVDAALAKVVSDNFAGMIVVDGEGTILAASRVACQLLNQDRPLEGLKIRAAICRSRCARRVEHVLAGNCARDASCRWRC